MEMIRECSPRNYEDATDDYLMGRFEALMDAYSMVEDLIHEE